MFSVAGRVIAIRTRLRILMLVGRSPKSVSRIAEELKLSQPLVSHHLKELRRCLLVNVERRGPFVYYQAADARIIAIIEQLRLLAADLLANRSVF